MKGALSPMAESTLFQQSIFHHDAFREAISNFEKTRKLPPPDEESPEWLAWDVACIEAYRAVVASIDHYCARRVHDVLKAVLSEQNNGVSAGWE